MIKPISSSNCHQNKINTVLKPAKKYLQNDYDKVDLHLHSSHSDGSDSTKELLKKIILSGIKIFALTDHDTVSGCDEIRQIVPEGIKFIPGIELTSKSKDLKCHILGLNCDYTNKTLLDLIEKGKQLRRQKLDTRINYLKDVWNIELTQEEKDWLYSRDSVVKTHLANVLVKRGLAKDNVSAMKKYLDGCKTGNTRFTIEESINAIEKSGGISVWAHPLGGEGEVHLSEKEFMPKFEEMKMYGIQGLECYYSRYNTQESEFLSDLANKNGLYVSGGSDYHGTNKDVSIARLNCDDEKVDFEKITILNAL